MCSTPGASCCRCTSPTRSAGAKKRLGYLGGTQSQTFRASIDHTILVANSKADTSPYSVVQKKAAELVGSAKNLAQFLDRDANPAFASTVMIPALQKFLGKPNDVDGLVNSIENQAKSIYTS